MKQLLFIVVLGVLSACSNPVEDLKSPCVGKDGSPCDRRAPVNQGLS
jgi:hypothetical protein